MIILYIYIFFKFYLNEMTSQKQTKAQTIQARDLPKTYLQIFFFLLLRTYHCSLSDDIYNSLFNPTHLFGPITAFFFFFFLSGKSKQLLLIFHFLKFYKSKKKNKKFLTGSGCICICDQVWLFVLAFVCLCSFFLSLIFLYYLQRERR